MQLFYWIPNTEDMAFIWRADLSILSQKTKIYKYSNTYLKYVLWNVFFFYILNIYYIEWQRCCKSIIFKNYLVIVLCLVWDVTRYSVGWFVVLLYALYTKWPVYKLKFRKKNSFFISNNMSLIKNSFGWHQCKIDLKKRISMF